MSERQYRKFTIKAVLELASPLTWLAAVMPALVGVASALALNPLVPAVFDLRAVVACLFMLLTALLMQLAVNAYNNSREHKAGIETMAVIHDIRDASIINSKVNDRPEMDGSYARNLAFVLLGGAVVCGFVAARLSSWPLLLAGWVVIAAFVLYFAGPKQISNLPLAELVFGVVMGGFITVATYYTITVVFSPLAVMMSLPPVLTIALIVLTSNNCNVERDNKLGRRSLPTMLERGHSIQLAKVLAWGVLVYMVAWVAALDVIIWRSLYVLVADAAFAAGLYLFFKRQLDCIASGPYDSFNHRQMMRTITGFCRNVNLVWVGICLLCYVLGEVMNLA